MLAAITNLLSLLDPGKAFSKFSDIVRVTVVLLEVLQFEQYGLRKPQPPE